MNCKYANARVSSKSLHDFKVMGQGEYAHITDVKVKNPVGFDIEKASRNDYSAFVKQGNKIGNKLLKQ